ncbi:hypothetical protein P691DRAFT_785838 [Macrolepiota fuliginosa MF-IS2]|uniref:Uncharacterized protein n=1 Tax=Macrolepiota fuliginosa MF-IS2 TaxID=1400762 RepID=A0A9P6BYB9_9AGAR|nr:hypothetical protein P691DRAFT_785838 [Macrolepiota fuliginosa MF-IS2]
MSAPRHFIVARLSCATRTSFEKGHNPPLPPMPLPSSPTCSSCLKIDACHFGEVQYLHVGPNNLNSLYGAYSHHYLFPADRTVCSDLPDKNHHSFPHPLPPPNAKSGPPSTTVMHTSTLYPVWQAGEREKEKRYRSTDRKESLPYPAQPLKAQTKHMENRFSGNGDNLSESMKNDGFSSDLRQQKTTLPDGHRSLCYNVSHPGNSSCCISRNGTAVTTMNVYGVCTPESNKLMKQLTVPRYTENGYFGQLVDDSATTRVKCTGLAQRTCSIQREAFAGFACMLKARNGRGHDRDYHPRRGVGGPLGGDGLRGM